MRGSSGSGQELLDPADAERRGVDRFPERIDATAAGAGDDERGNAALRRPEAGPGALAGRVLRLGRTIRWETPHGYGDRSGGCAPSGSRAAVALGRSRRAIVVTGSVFPYPGSGRGWVE